MHKRHHHRDVEVLKSSFARCELLQQLCFQGDSFRDLALLILQYEEPGVFLVQVEAAGVSSGAPREKGGESKNAMITYKWLDLRYLSEQADLALENGVTAIAAVFRAKCFPHNKPASSTGPVWSPQTADGQAVVLTGLPVGWYYWALNHAGVLGLAQQQQPDCTVLKKSGSSSPRLAQSDNLKILSVGENCGESALHFLKPSAATVTVDVPHWCTTCCSSPLAKLNAFLHRVASQDEQTTFSVSQSSPFLLVTNDSSNYWEDASFRLVALPSLEPIATASFHLRADAVTCPVAGGWCRNHWQENHSVPTSVDLNSSRIRDGLWATTMCEKTKTQYFWYAVHHLETGHEMRVYRQNVRVSDDCVSYPLPGVYSRDGYGACRLFSDQKHVYVVVFRPTHWEHDLTTGKKKPSLKPRLFCYVHPQEEEGKEGQFEEVPSPAEQVFIVADYKGRFDQDDLMDYNDYLHDMRVEEEQKTSEGRMCEPVTMADYEQHVYENYVQNRVELTEWQLKEAMVVPSSGDLLIDIQQYPPFSQLITLPRPATFKQTYMYVRSKKQWVYVAKLGCNLGMCPISGPDCCEDTLRLFVDQCGGMTP